MDLATYLERPPWPPQGPIPIGGKELIFYPGGSPNGWHRIETFGECRRLSAFYAAGYDIHGNGDALVLGGLIHTGLAHFYARQGLNVPGNTVNILGRPTPASAGARNSLHEPLVAIDVAAQLSEAREDLTEQAKWVVGTYAKQYSLSHPRQFTVLGVEMPLSTTIAADLPDYTVLLDLVVRRMDGLIAAVDHKSAANPTEAHFTEYGMSGQFYGQRMSLGRVLPAGVDIPIEVNLIGKERGRFSAKMRPLTLSGHILAAFPGHVEQALRERAALAQAHPPQRDPYAWPPRLSGGSGGGCRNRYRTCGALGLCWGGPGGPADERLRRPAIWSEESE